MEKLCIIDLQMAQPSIAHDSNNNYDNTQGFSQAEVEELLMDTTMDTPPIRLGN